MTDIVERLRDLAEYDLADAATRSLSGEAADEIERLREDRDSWKILAERADERADHWLALVPRADRVQFPFVGKVRKV